MRGFLQRLFFLVGIEDTPSFDRNKVSNTSEAMQTLMLAANYLDEEYITRKACAILGDPDAAEEILKRRDAEELIRLGTAARSSFADGRGQTGVTGDGDGSGTSADGETTA